MKLWRWTKTIEVEAETAEAAMVQVAWRLWELETNDAEQGTLEDLGPVPSEGE